MSLATRGSASRSRIAHINAPALLADFRPDLLGYYWDAERPCFRHALAAIGRQAPVEFGKPWQVIEGEYRRLYTQTLND